MGRPLSVLPLVTGRDSDPGDQARCTLHGDDSNGRTSQLRIGPRLHLLRRRAPASARRNTESLCFGADDPLRNRRRPRRHQRSTAHHDTPTFIRASLNGVPLFSSWTRSVPVLLSAQWVRIMGIAAPPTTISTTTVLATKVP